MSYSLPPSLQPPENQGSGIGRIILILLILAVIGGGAYWYFSKPKDAVEGDSAAKHTQGTNGGGRGGRHAGYDPSNPTPITVASVQKGDIDVTRRALGTVTSLASITVRTQVSGLLMEVGFHEGQLVEKGDFLAQIDPRPFQNALEQATGALQRDEALQKDAQLNLERFQTLLKQDSISKQQVDTQASLVQQQQGNVVTDRSQIDAANLNLTYAHITAPVAGRVGLRQVDAGNYVQTSDTNGIVTITQLQPITVVFTLPEDDVPAVMKLYNAGATLAAIAYDRAQTTKLATGSLIAADNQIDPTTGTVKLKAQFDNNDSALFPNQFVNIELTVSTIHDAAITTSAAIQRGTNGTFVYKLNDDSTVSVAQVKLGVTQGDNVQVTDGIAPGDKVVTEGVDKLRDGAKVSVKEGGDKKDTGDKAKDAPKDK